MLRAVQTKGRGSGGRGSRGQLIVLRTTGTTAVLLLQVYVTSMSVSLMALWLSHGHILDGLLVV